MKQRDGDGLHGLQFDRNPGYLDNPQVIEHVRDQGSDQQGIPQEDPGETEGAHRGVFCRPGREEIGAGAVWKYPVGSGCCDLEAVSQPKENSGAPDFQGDSRHEF